MEHGAHSLAAPMTAGARLATDWTQRMDEVERPFRDAFRDFVHDLRADRPMFMFFTGGKLHLAHRALEYLAGRNVVLVTGQLSDDERAWLDERWSLPLFNVPIRIDGNTVWEFLFDACRRPFVWVDSDCFVFDRSLPDRLFEAVEATPTTAVAGTFVFRPVELISTPFAAVSPEVVRRVRERVGEITPTIYAYLNTATARTAPHAVARLVTPEHIEALRAVVPLDRRGRPTQPQEGVLDVYGDGGLFPTTWRDSDDIPEATRRSGRLHTIFDTLVLYQLVALGLGFTVHPVLRLGNYLGLEGVQGCDRILHVGGVASYSELPPDSVGVTRVGSPMAHRMRRARAVDRALLQEFVAAGAPVAYAERLARMSEVLGVGDQDRAPVAEEFRRAGVDAFFR